MDLQDKIGQMLMVGFHGLEAPSYLLDWLREGRAGGVILFARNVESPEQLAKLTASLHAAAKYPLLIGIDQEGGTVARLRQSHGFSESPGAMALSSASNGAELAEQVDQMLAEEMRALGINWDFAPVLDITYNRANASVGTRSFGMDRQRVAQMGSAAVRGFQRGGVAACAKHFPGLGTTSTDTHVALPVLDTPLETLREVDMQPFKAAIAAGIASVMSTHTIFSALDPQLPATLSPLIIPQLLRGDLGFDGVVASDDLEMKAIADHHGAGETAVLGALAGLDVLIFSHTRVLQEAAHDALLAAAQSGRVPIERIDEANRRVAALKAAYPARPGSLSTIRQPEHVELALRAARSGTTLLRGNSALPLEPNTSALVEFPSNLESGIVESGGLTGFASALQQYFPEMPTIALGSPEAADKARQITQSAEALVLASRNAHLNPDSVKFAQELIDAAKRTVLVCLRAPYDASKLTGAQTVICTCGDSAPSLQAAAEALAGKFTPTGKLPVTLE